MAAGEIGAQPHPLALSGTVRGHHHRSHGAPAKDTVETAHVVEVRMGENDQRHLPDSHGAQAAVHRHRVRPRVHHHGPPRPRRDEQSVSLADVAGHQ